MSNGGHRGRMCHPHIPVGDPRCHPGPGPGFGRLHGLIRKREQTRVDRVQRGHS